MHEQRNLVRQVALDYSERSQAWTEMLRLWVITTSHDKYEAELGKIRESHRKSTQVRRAPEAAHSRMGCQLLRCKSSNSNALCP